MMHSSCGLDFAAIESVAILFVAEDGTHVCMSLSKLTQSSSWP